MGLADIANDIKKVKLPKEKPQEELFGLAGKVASKAGKQAKIGNKFQKEIEKTCKFYRLQRVAWIQMFYPPTQWIPSNKAVGKPGFLMHVKKTGFDFIGVYKTKTTKIWTPIFIECKSTEHGRISVGQEDSGIKIHQLEELTWLEQNGLEAWIFWQIRGAEFVMYRFTPFQLMEMIGEKKSLNISDCEEHKIPRMFKVDYKNELVYDFLDQLEGW